jgi:15-cis-phytoene desaturase
LIASNIIYSYRATHLTDDQIIEGIFNELAEFLPHVRDAQLTHAKINRIPVGIYCPFPGIDAYRPSTRTPIDRFFLAGDWTQTSLPFSMESAVRSGALAAEAVLSDEGQSANLAVELQISGGLSNALEWTKFGSPQFLRGLGR